MLDGYSDDPHPELQPGCEPLETTFELNDTLYATAHVPYTDEVYLWLGANVMLAYPLDEAETLLQGRLKGAKDSLANCEEDLDFLREQITVFLHSTPMRSIAVGMMTDREIDDGGGYSESV